MAMDKATLEAIARQKQYEDRMDELRRESAERTQQSLDNLAADVTDHSKKYDENYDKFRSVARERNRQMGMETLPTLIMQMGPALEAYAKMSQEYKLYVWAKFSHAVALNVNYQSSPFSILEAVAEGSRWIQANLERAVGLTDALPPVFVPYLAEVADNGVLSVNLDVPNSQMTDADKQQFVAQYQTDFETSIANWINASQTSAGEDMTIEDTAEGRKIRIGDAAGADARYMTKEDFLEFRARVLEPALQQHFTVDFKPETSRNMAP
ncbi:MAG: hypothetical protein WCR08_00840 [Gammaproteobacteria bacterium]